MKLGTKGTKIIKLKYGCVKIVTRRDYSFPDKFTGRAITFAICPVRDGIHITRGGRRGGARRDPVRTARAGMLMCTAEGVQSKCLRGKDFVASPGGKGQMQKWPGGPAPLFNSYGSPKGGMIRARGNRRRPKHGRR